MANKSKDGWHRLSQREHAPYVSEKGEKIVPEEAAFVCLFKTAFLKGK